MAFGRAFSFGKEDRRYQLTVRAEFQNIFNRLYYSVPTGSGNTFITNPIGHANSLSGTTGLLSSGFGYSNWLNGGTYNTLGAGPAPRSGQIVAKFTF
jgi:hypothetical protein